MSLKVGDPFNPETFQGPQVSEIQFNVSRQRSPRSASCISRINVIAYHELYPIRQGRWGQSRGRR